MDKALPENRHLIDYLPPVLRKVREFQAINEAVEPEFVLAWEAVRLILDNQFLDTATEAGVSVWERELKIRPKDTDTMEIRKARVKAMWNLKLPYTVPWLKTWLTSLCGPTGHDVVITDYTIDIQLDYSVLPDAKRLAAEILEILLTTRPSNTLMLMTSALQSEGSVRLGACSERSIHMDLWPMLVNELESTGGVVMAGPLEFHAMVEIYPFEQEDENA